MAKAKQAAVKEAARQTAPEAKSQKRANAGAFSPRLKKLYRGK